MPATSFTSPQVSSTQPTVFVVDDDPEFRESVQLLLASVGLRVETYASAEQFLGSQDWRRPGCVLTDVRMPGMSGLELQKRLASEGVTLPVIVITAHAEVPMAVEAMRAGAVDFVQKPHSPQQLLERIQEAIRHDAEQRERTTTRQQTQQRLAALSPREHEIMVLLLEGLNAKEIAHRLNISTKTVDFHRRNLLEKMQVETLVELSRLVQDSGPAPSV